MLPCVHSNKSVFFLFLAEILSLLSENSFHLESDKKRDEKGLLDLILSDFPCIGKKKTYALTDKSLIVNKQLKNPLAI